MAISKFIFCAVLFISCNANKKANEAKVAELKEKHKAAVNLMRNLPEPYYAKVADSMKKWIPVFRNVLADDQQVRAIGYGISKEEWKEQSRLDSQNLHIVTAFLDQYGWPEKYDIGFIGQRAIGITIQHSPLKVQEKYYPSLVQAYQKDPLLFETLALLEDRINIRNHRFQYYGSQVVTYKGKPLLYPVFNIDSIDLYRRRIGMYMPIKEYLAMLKVNWDINEYKQMLPGVIKEFKVSDTLGIHFSKE